MNGTHLTKDKNMSKTLELNGFANIIMVTEMALEDGEISEEVARTLIDQAEQGIRYMSRRNKGEECKWHDCRKEK